MRIFPIAMLLGGLLIAGCENGPTYGVQRATDEWSSNGVRMVVTQQFLATSGFFEEDVDAGVEYSASATNTNSYRVCVFMTFYAPNLEERGISLHHNKGHVLDPGQTKNIGYVRFANDKRIREYNLDVSRAWVINSANQYCESID